LRQGEKYLGESSDESQRADRGKCEDRPLALVVELDLRGRVQLHEHRASTPDAGEPDERQAVPVPQVRGNHRCPVRQHI